MPAKPPNILMIVTDDHQFDAMGAAGSTVVRTPHLDGLARRGTRFAQAAMMGSLIPAVCSPARACLLTGTTPWQADRDPRLQDQPQDSVELPPDLATLPELCGRAGYETFITGKWHNDLAALRRSFQRGTAIFTGGMCDHRRVPVRTLEQIRQGATPAIKAGFSTEIFCRAAVDFIHDRDQDRPFFAYVALTSPHDPRTPPPAYRAYYPPAQLPLPPGFLPQPAFDNGELAVRDERLAPKPLQPEVLREHLADYYGMITHQDAQIGYLLNALETAGIAAETIVAYVGDHGLALGRHGLLGKQNLYGHSVRVPLLLAGPGVPAGRVADELGYSFDLNPTLLGLAGLPVPAGRAGRPLPLAADGAARGREYLVHFYKDVQRAIRDERWKLIEYAVGGTRRTELFDLATDPHEQTDLSGDAARSDVIHRLRHELAAWQQASGDRWMPLAATKN